MRRARLLLVLGGLIPALAYEVHLEYMEVTGMAVDSAGGVYLSGYDSSTWGLYTTQGSQRQLLKKLDAAGTPVYTAHVGDFTYGNLSLPPTGIQVSSIAVDAAGSAYITGFVNQAGLQTAHAAQPLPGGEGDAFVARLREDGLGWVYFTYLGGSGRDWGRRVAVGADGNAYITGYTCSTDFPTVNAAQPAFGGDGIFGCDAFVAKLDPTGSTLVYSTYLGGSSGEYGLAIATDAAGNTYVAGVTSSANFPTLKASQAEGTCGHTTKLCTDGFVTKLDAAGTFLYSTYLGGSEYEQVEGIASDPGGNAYVTGTTGSCDFPTTRAFQPRSGNLGGSCADAFVVKINPEGQWVYSTYLGGEGGDHGEAIAADADGNAYVTGGTFAADFPTMNPIQTPARGTAFITKLDSMGSTLLFSTYYGVTREERETQGQAIALDEAGNLYISVGIIGGVISDQFIVKIDALKLRSDQ
jgi:hypothetical protein